MWCACEQYRVIIMISEKIIMVVVGMGSLNHA